MIAPESTPAVTVMIAYELPHVRAALRALLELEPNVVVLADAVDFNGLLPALQSHDADVLVLGVPPELERARRAGVNAGAVLVGVGGRADEGPAGPGEPCYVPLGEAGRALAKAVRAAARAPAVAFAER
ncbi:MAG TPA: hypothetical protein VK307_01060 [Thermoleophilaceae bacterium]|nr:hypothetical protein [Thermoleophilaceae bacterium]